MGQCKKDITPVLTHWSYIFLALTHQYTESIKWQNKHFFPFSESGLVQVNGRGALEDRASEAPWEAPRPWGDARGDGAHSAGHTHCGPDPTGAVETAPLQLLPGGQTRGFNQVPILHMWANEVQTGTHLTNCLSAHNWPISQIPQCTCSISHNTPFRTEMCTFLFWMVHCGIWDRCIVGFVNWANWILWKFCFFKFCFTAGGLSCFILVYCGLSGEEFGLQLAYQMTHDSQNAMKLKISCCKHNAASWRQKKYGGRKLYLDALILTFLHAYTFFCRLPPWLACGSSPLRYAWSSAGGVLSSSGVCFPSSRPSSHSMPRANLWLCPHRGESEKLWLTVTQGWF